MQTASGALTDAILASERRPVQLVEVDWDGDGFGGPGTIDDLSGDVVSVSVDRDLSTDLPTEVKLFAGYSAAEATVTLARQSSSPVPSVTTVPYGAPIAYGDANYSYAGTGPPTVPAGPITHTTWYYSPYNTASPLYGKRRKGAPARISFGMVGANGPEYLKVLDGRVRSLQVRSKTRDVELIIDDLSVTMRKQVTLPMVISDGENGTTAVRPGLNTTFLADWLARKCGYYASPPARSSAQVVATLHGSGHPEKGNLQSFRGANLSRLAYSPTAQFPKSAPWVMAVNLNGTDAQIISYVLANQSSVSTNDGDAFFWEGWVRFDTISNEPAFMIAYKTGVSVPYVSLFVDSANGRLQSTFNRGGSDNTQRSTGASGPAGIVANTWYYIAAYWAFTSTAVKVWLRVNGTTTGPISVTTPSVTNAPFINTVGVGRGQGASFADSFLDGLISDVQLTSENTGSTNPPSWNDAFVPTAQIMADENNLVATPVVTDEAWSIMQQLAQAEFATAQFDELGMFRWLTRKRWTQAPWNQVQRVLTSATAIKDLSSTESVDQVRNHVIVRAIPPDVQDYGDIWSLSTLVAIAGGGAKTIWADFDQPAANIDLTLTSHGVAGQSRYNASTARDGQGNVVSNLSISVTAFAQSAKIVITNPNASTAYLVGNTGVSSVTAGVPSMRLVGQAVKFQQDAISTKMRSEATDAASIAAFGVEQVLELPDNAFRQDPDSIENLAQDLLAQLKDPKPVLQDVPLVGDPRLQLGDRDMLQDPDGLALNQDVHLSSVHTEFTQDGGLAQVVNVRPA